MVELEEIKRRVLQEDEQEVDLTEERNVDDTDNVDVEEVEQEEVEIEITREEVDMNEEQRDSAVICLWTYRVLLLRVS